MANNRYSLLGYKYQQVNSAGKVITRRIIEECVHGGGYKCIDDNNVVCVVPKSRLLNDYVKINPDAMVNFMITDKDAVTANGEPDVEHPIDIYVCIHKVEQLVKNNLTPEVIIRQNVFVNDYEDADLDQQIANAANMITVGMAVVDCFHEGRTKDFMEYDTINTMYSIHTYVDDTLDTICKMISASNIDTEFREAFKMFKDRLGEAAPMVTGVCSTLPEFLKNNHFIECYRQMFNITCVDWPVEFEQTKYDEDGYIRFNNKQTAKFLETFKEVLNGLATDIKALPYDKDIDVSRIVSHKHLLISDSNGKIYLVVYNT